MSAPSNSRLPEQQSIAHKLSATSSPVLLWATLGLLMLLFQLYVWGSWISGPNFVPTDPGPDPIGAGQKFYFLFIQIAIPIAAAICLWFWVVRPWRRDGKMSADGMIAIAGSAAVFWDMSMNYTSTVLLYNSHLINFGSWTLGSWPGWTSPNGNLLPEPLVAIVPGYTALVVSQAYVICWVLRKAKERWPGLGVISIIGLIIIGLTCLDSVIEMALVRSGIYAYPGGIRAITLFAGETYQFPLSEGFLFGGLGIGSIAILRFFKDDKGQSFAERGLEKLRVGEVARQWLRFLAIFGFIHGAFFMLYMVPSQWFSTHSDPFPEGYPSYLINHMCVYGEHRNQCPGPGISMPRPLNNPF